MAAARSLAASSRSMARLCACSACAAKRETCAARASRRDSRSCVRGCSADFKGSASAGAGVLDFCGRSVDRNACGR